MTLVEKMLKEMRSKMDKTVEHYQNEFAKIRTGKASPALVESLNVQYYGKPTRLREIAGITTPEPRTIIIQPWDPTVVGDVVKAINISGLGITPISDGKIIRLPIPELDEERRKDLDKMVKKLAEEGRVALRNIRRETNDELKRLQKEGKITEDDLYRNEDDVQKMTDERIEKIDELLSHKEKEIMEV